MTCFFVSDMHGREDRWKKLFAKIEEGLPDAVFLGGDLFPDLISLASENEISKEAFLLAGFAGLKKQMKDRYPRIFLILGNEDGTRREAQVQEAESAGLLEYMHNRKTDFGPYSVFGYSFVPPTPYQLKDWERYDVSRYIDPGCISPEEGMRSVPVPMHKIRYETIQNDLTVLSGDKALSKAIFLFHSPPYKTNLDRAALDGKMIDHVPLDVHVGSIAIKRFIEKRQPLLTLHGHVHESASITGSWKDKIGETNVFGAAHNGPELALLRFDPENLSQAERALI